MQARVASRAHERAVERIVAHLSALYRLMREPEAAGLAWLETRLGLDLAARARGRARRWRSVVTAGG